MTCLLPGRQHPRFRCLRPIAQGLLDQFQLLGHRPQRLAILDPLDGQFFEFSRVGTLRNLYLQLPRLTFILRHPWKTKFRGKLIPTGGVPLTLEQAKAWFYDHGESITDWANANGFRRETVYAVLAGRTPGLRGDAHRVALALGIKALPASTNAPDSSPPTP